MSKEAKNEKIRLIAQTFASISASLAVTILAGAILSTVLDGDIANLNKRSFIFLLLVYITLGLYLLRLSLKMLDEWLK